MTDDTSTAPNAGPTTERTPFASTDETPTGNERVGSPTTCSECGGNVINDSQTDDLICEDCGLVIREKQIDHGPEWRDYSDDPDNQSTSRVGAPVTETLHDKGLSTSISWRDQDSNGNTVSPRKRQQLKRLRKWNERTRTKSGRERSLQNALGEISRMTSALDLPRSVRECACNIYRQALDADMIKGRSIEGMAAGALLAALRICETPRTINTVSHISQVSQKRVSSAYRYISRDLDIPLQTFTPMDHFAKLASEACVCNETMQKSEEIVQQHQELGLHSGRKPTAIAAAALYLVDRATGKPDNLTQKEMAEIAEVSAVTIRNRKDEFKELIKDGTIDAEFSNRLLIGNTIGTDENGKPIMEPETVDGTIHVEPERGETQMDVYARTLRKINDEYGLLDKITVPYRPGDNYLNAWLNTEPKQPFGEEDGNWKRITDDCYAQAKMDLDEKKDRLRHFAAIVNVEVEFANW